ncbi:hypothetical protein LTR04_004224 [Oleoguttula sp. CCFEE 6159]|nr:hypothetical protein LTR04_004224 [Oleoguttula sp. CCFEE 6159]
MTISENHSDVRDYHKDMILHALLEDKCLQEALDQLNSQPNALRARYNKQHPEVRVLAKAKYEHASNQLARHGLVAPGGHEDRLHDTRQGYRRALELLSRNSTPLPEVGYPPNQVALHDTLPDQSILVGTGPEFSTIPSLLATLIDHEMVDTTRYGRDFVELDLLGKGGYGKVYRVNHKLDGRQYAVKKIPLSSSRIHRIQQNGQAELDALLMELQTIARLEHPNIVRYYSGWIEYSTAHNAVTSTEAPWTSHDAGFPRQRLLDGPQNEFTYDVNDTIVFGEDSTAPSSHSRARRTSHGTAYTISSTRSERDTFPNVADDDDDNEVENIPRLTEQLSDLASGLHSNGSMEESSISDNLQSGIVPSVSHGFRPNLSLCIQMSLHPLSLADFLSSEPARSVEPGSRHCFHLQPSLQLLLSIMDGVEYLHSEGVVHRDLKPSNIFMSLHSGHVRPAASIDLGSCRNCQKAGPKSNEQDRTTDQLSELSQQLVQKPLYLNLRIGDFGLVSAIAQPNAELPPAPSKAVGTEIYRPPSHYGFPSAKLDVFALGIIAFELLWKFDTRMERVDILQKLKTGVFPSDFSTKTGDSDGKVEAYIRSMLHSDEEERSTCAEVRMQVEGILAKEH